MNIEEVKVTVEQIENSIYLIRGEKVMLDADLAQLYVVETKILNKAVKRNLDRFPEDFMFQLTTEESKNLRFQIGTSKKQRGGRRYLPRQIFLMLELHLKTKSCHMSRPANLNLRSRKIWSIWILN